MEREDDKTFVVKRRCVNPFSNVFEEFGPTEDSESFGDSWSDFHDDSCVFSKCLLAVSSVVPVVIDVSVSPPSVLGGSICPAMSDEPEDHAVTGGRDESLHHGGGHSPEHHAVALENTDEQQVQRTSQTTPHTQQNTLL